VECATKDGAGVAAAPGRIAGHRLRLAVKPVGQYQRLLSRDPSSNMDAFIAYDPLVYYVDNEIRTTIPFDTWEAALSLSDVDNLLSVGYAAFAHEQAAIAKKAWRDAMDRGHGGAAFNLGELLEEAGDVAGANSAYEKARELGQEGGPKS